MQRHAVLNELQVEVFTCGRGKLNLATLEEMYIETRGDIASNYAQIRPVEDKMTNVERSVSELDSGENHSSGHQTSWTSMSTGSIVPARAGGKLLWNGLKPTAPVWKKQRRHRAELRESDGRVRCTCVYDRSDDGMISREGCGFRWGEVR